MTLRPLLQKGIVALWSLLLLLGSGEVAHGSVTECLRLQWLEIATGDHAATAEEFVNAIRKYRPTTPDLLRHILCVIARQ